jgi:hypothetical protein
MTKRVSFALSAAVTGVFFGLVLVMAFRPHLLTGFRGLTLSFWFIVFTLVAMAGYSWWRIARLDKQE